MFVMKKTLLCRQNLKVEMGKSCFDEPKTKQLKATQGYINVQSHIFTTIIYNTDGGGQAMGEKFRDIEMNN